MTIAELKQANKAAGGKFFDKGKSKALPNVKKVRGGHIFATKDKGFSDNVQVRFWLAKHNGRIDLIGMVDAGEFSENMLPYFYPNDVPELKSMVERLPGSVASIGLKVLQRADKDGFALI